MIEENDWRLEVAPKDLDNEKLIKEDVANFYKVRKDEWDGKNPFEFWDHDHCAFCFEKFMVETAAEQPFAYRSQDYNTWICETCYNDFNEKFKWKLIENKNEKPNYLHLIETSKDCIAVSRIIEREEK